MSDRVVGYRSSTPLLVGQALSLGLMLAFLIVPGSAIFLEHHGAARLPFVYLAVAFAGTAASSLLNRLQASVDLFRLAIAATLASALVSVVAWLLLAVAERPTASFGVMVLFALQVQFGFVFIGSQAGRVYDVQQIKRNFPRIESGFVFGFMLGGFAAEPLLRIVSEPADLLLMAALSGCGFAGLIRLTSGRAPPVAGETGAESRDEPASIPLRTLLGIPLVGAVFVYQVLSAMGTQFVEYLVFERAAAEFDGATEMASFMGRFTAGLNLVDLIVLVLLGGVLMARYGLRFGIGANPIIVTALVAAALVVVALPGEDGSALFWLVIVARVLDITVADAATRTSVNATFQALPSQLRLPAQLGVEGAGVPVALGLTAGLILVVNAATDSAVAAVLLVAAVVCVFWCGSAVVVFGRYRLAVVDAARRGLFDAEAIDVSEPETTQALLAVAAGDRPQDVGVALRLLGGSADSRVVDLAREKVTDSSSSVRGIALGLLADRDSGSALEPALGALSKQTSASDRAERLAAMRALSQIRNDSAEVALVSESHSYDGEYAAVALGCLIRQAGGASASETASSEIARLAASRNPTERSCAAAAIAEAATVTPVELLGALLGDKDRRVSERAGTAIAKLAEAERLAVFEHLRVTPGDQVSGLLRFLQVVAPEGDQLVRSIAEWTPGADAQLRGPALRALLRAGAGPNGEFSVDVRVLGEALMDRELADIDRINGWLQAIGPGTDAPGARLARALRVELLEARARLISSLGPLVGARLVRRTAAILEGRRAGDSGMAVETLELTLEREHRGRVLAALQSVSLTLDESADPAADTATGRWDAARELSSDLRWAVHRDWVYACALTVLLEHDALPTDLAAGGPISAEVLASAIA